MVLQKRRSGVHGLSTADVFRYGLIYAACVIAAWLLLLGLEMVFPGSRGIGPNTLAAIGCISMTLTSFLQDKRRIPSTSEYWILVLISVAVSILIETTIVLGAFYFTNQPLPAIRFFAVIVASVFALQMIMCSIFYSPFFARRLLKRIKKPAPSE